MKKLIYLVASLIMVASLISCEKEKLDNSQLSPDGETLAMSEPVIINSSSTPISAKPVTPVIISGKNNGGNRTCEEVGIALMDDADYFDLCGDKVDYDETGFASGFPSGLSVSVDGNFISFTTDDCIPIAGKNYKVGAVIVKGSNNANVYFYEGGTLSDAGLAAPEALNMVSNLTFCFIECEEVEEIVIAIKCKYMAGPEYQYYAGLIKAGCSDAEVDYFVGDCANIGVNYYPTVSSFLMRSFWTPEIIGEVTVEKGVNNTLIITIDLKGEGMLYETYLYAGSLEGLNSTVSETDGCPGYDTSDKWESDFTVANTVQITVFD